jgi:hypothetical protein
MAAFCDGEASAEKCEAPSTALSVILECGRRFCAPARASAACVAEGPRVNGIAQWIALEMDKDTLYENRPALGATSCWAVLFHPLPHPIDVSPGQEIRIFGSHDRHHVSIWCDPYVSPELL